MKKLYLYLTILIVYSCSNSVDCSEINFKEGFSFYKSQKFTGDCTSYFYNNTLRSKQSYLNGQDHGSWVFYFSNGNLRTEAFFNSGKRIGQWKYYASNGGSWKINSYDSLGQPTGKWETYDTLDGKLISKKDVREILLKNE